MHETFDEQVYNSLNGFYIPEQNVPGVENAFQTGMPCMQLYEAASDAYERLCHRLGVQDEDEDVEIIFNSFAQITKILCLKMFAYGSSLSSPDATEEIGIELSEVK